MDAIRKFWSIRTKLLLMMGSLLTVVLVVQYYLHFQEEKLILGKITELNEDLNSAVSLLNQNVLQMHGIEAEKSDRSMPDDLESLGFVFKFGEGNPGLTHQIINGIDDGVFIQIPDVVIRERAKTLRALKRRTFSKSRLAQLWGEEEERINELMKRFENSNRLPIQVFSPIDPSRSSEGEHNRYQFGFSSEMKLSDEPDKAVLNVPVIQDNKVNFIQLSYRLNDFSDLITTLRNKNLAVMFGLFLFGIIAAAVMSSRFTMPISNLNRSFDRVVSGDLSFRLESKTKDEIGALTLSFNQMVEKLRTNREIEKTLFRKDRLSSLGQLASGVAHEIRNPLNAINLTIRHLQDKITIHKESDRALFSRYTDNILEEVARLNSIVTTFLSFTKTTDLELKKVVLNKLIDEVLTLLGRDLTAKEIEVESNVSGSSVVFNLDEEKMKTVLLNIFLNAIQAMPNGGILKISVQEDNNKISIVTEDTGCGIAAEWLDKVFDLYYTTKDDGTGLGLPMAHQIIKEHGGDMTIDSKQGFGTKVVIELPADELD